MSRISLIKKYTWPPQDAGDTVRELITVYTNRGHILSPKTKTKSITKSDMVKEKKSVTSQLLSQLSGYRLLSLFIVYCVHTYYHASLTRPSVPMIFIQGTMPVLCERLVLAYPAVLCFHV
jgi:hypothetical protein